MTDFHTLDDAFAEFERRADQTSARSDAGATHRAAPATRRTRPLLVAASVAAVVAIAGGGVLLARQHDSDPRTRAAGGPPASVSAPASASASDPTTSAPPSVPALPSASTSAPVYAPPSHLDSASASSPPAGRTAFPPSTPQQLQQQFEAVLQGTATITLDESGAQPSDPYIKGVLTAADGARGGYDIQILDAGRGDKADCSDDDGPCVTSQLAGGATLAVKTTPVDSGRATTYEMSLVRRDGTEFLFDLSNQTDPKGAGPVLGAHPPLTTQQMTTILQSARW